MMSFLKSFLSNEKSTEEQALAASLKKRDVMVVDGYEPEEEQAGGCGTQKRGCGGCGCG
jgi:hypothetical protein